MNINIYQGKTNLEHSDVNIIIDVIRAFSVSFFAFKRHVDKIKLVNLEEEALLAKKKYPNSLLSGEVAGYKIDSFDFGNSPYEVSSKDLSGKTLIQKTTNGVAVALASLNASHVIVTGFNNAYSTALYVKDLLTTLNKESVTVNIIASHPDGREDFACAKYIEKLLLDDFSSIQKIEEETSSIILNSQAAKKFLDTSNHDFSILDLLLCASPFKSEFIMEVEMEGGNLPVIIKKNRV